MHADLISDAASILKAHIPSWQALCMKAIRQKDLVSALQISRIEI